MRKIILVCVLMLTAVPCFAQNVITNFPIRQRTRPYLVAGQAWQTTEFANIQNTRPEWYAGGGLRILLSEDIRWQAAIEIKKGIFRRSSTPFVGGITNLNWYISYHF